MSVNIFAHVGVFAIASVGFGLGTGLLGILIVPDNWKQIPFVSWIVGIIIYGLTVMFMWKG